jgi:hypothetical protein
MMSKTSDRREKECSQKRRKTLLRKIRALNQRFNTQVYIELKEENGKLLSFSTPNYQPQRSENPVVNQDTFFYVEMLTVSRYLYTRFCRRKIRIMLNIPDPNRQFKQLSLVLR